MHAVFRDRRDIFKLLPGIMMPEIDGWEARVLKDFPEHILKYFRPHYLKLRNTFERVYYAIPLNILR